MLRRRADALATAAVTALATLLAAGFAPFFAGFARFFGSKLVGITALMGGTATLTCDFASLLVVHCCESPFGTA